MGNRFRSRLLAVPAPVDTGSYAGIKVKANGLFAVEAKVFSTLGTLLDKVSFNVTQAESEKLPLLAGDSSRVPMMLWNGRTQDGKPAGTGARPRNPPR